MVLFRETVINKPCSISAYGIMCLTFTLVWFVYCREKIILCANNCDFQKGGRVSNRRFGRAPTDGITLPITTRRQSWHLLWPYSYNFIGIFPILCRIIGERTLLWNLLVNGGWFMLSPKQLYLTLPGLEILSHE